MLRLGTIKGIADYYFDWLAHPRYDDYWKRWSIDDHDSQILVPALHVGAWYDLFLGGSLRNYLGIKRGGGSETARSGQRLLVMTGGHAGAGRKIGEVDFGEQSVVDLAEVEFRWYDYLLKDIQNGVNEEKPVKIFVMGPAGKTSRTDACCCATVVRAAGPAAGVLSAARTKQR